MHKQAWLVSIFAAGCLTGTGLVNGCSNSSSPAPVVPVDAGPDVVDTGTLEDVDDGGDAADVGSDDGGDAADAEDATSDDGGDASDDASDDGGDAADADDAGDATK